MEGKRCVRWMIHRRCRHTTCCCWTGVQYAGGAFDHVVTVARTDTLKPAREQVRGILAQPYEESWHREELEEWCARWRVQITTCDLRDAWYSTAGCDLILIEPIPVAGLHPVDAGLLQDLLDDVEKQMAKVAHRRRNPQPGRVPRFPWEELREIQRLYKLAERPSVPPKWNELLEDAECARRLAE